jgi:hypothetical protein
VSGGVPRWSFGSGRAILRPSGARGPGLGPEEISVLRRTPVRGTGSVRLTFTLPLETPPGPVSVVGDFNSWRPGAHLLVRRTNGTRSASVTVAAGSTLRFRYLGPDGLWFDDDHADELDHRGGLVSV